MPPDSAEMIIA